jgi:peptidoglycan/xylan/chitin deacetylase (PgdA/CDA1 family)
MIKYYPKNFPHGIMFHRFHNVKDSFVGQGSISSNEFERIVKFVGVKRILNPEEWLFKLKSSSLKKSDLCITFDDCLKSQLKIAIPILEKFNIKAFFFLNTSVLYKNYDLKELVSYVALTKFKSFNDFFISFLEHININLNFFKKNKKYIEYSSKTKKNFKFYCEQDLQYRFIRDFFFSKKKFLKKINNFFYVKKISIKKLVPKIWMNKQDIKKLLIYGHTVGLHSHNHYSNFSKLNYIDQKREYLINFNYLKKISKSKILSMSHPLNSYNKNTLKILNDLGIVCGFRSNIYKPHNSSKINPSNLEMAREDSANIIISLKKK